MGLEDKAPDERLFIGCQCPCCPWDHGHGLWFICASIPDPQKQSVVLVGSSPLFGSRENKLFPTALSVSVLHSKLYISVHQIQDLPLFDRHYQVQRCPSI